ncbi:MAG: amidohydrolase [Oscillospiraceae bacterium]|nr:amidohydrolase [Oscillospiraceae bacterium]
MRTVFHNALVYTGELPLQQAFAVENGVFTLVGSNEELLATAADDDELVDLGGRFVCAGFNDSHMHLLNFGQSLQAAKLAPVTDSLSGMLDHLAAFLKSNPPRPGQWLVGRGWNQDYFTDVSRMPDRHDLDVISSEIPILITRTCGHCCVVNSRVLELAGIGPDTPSPDGGDIGREADGQPDGRLFDNAIDLLSPVVPLPDKEGLKEMIRLACAALNSYGVTSSQTDDYCVFRSIPFETVNEAYRELEQSGELSVRVYEQSNITTMEELECFIAEGNVTGAGSDLFRIGPLKLLGDGALGSRTAHLSLPYKGTDEYGFDLFSDEHMNSMVSYANAHGMQVAIHAIGDACLDQVLNAVDNALRENPRSDHRHGVVHCQVSRPDQLRRIAELGMHVYAQSIFLDYDNHIVDRLLEPELATSSYCWKTLLENGVSVSNGSDCPVELPDVMEGIQCAVTRTSMDGTGPYLPAEAFTVQEAIDSFTIRSAEASFEENVKGLIREGYIADFVVLGADPFVTAPEDIHSIPVQSTWLGGRCVYSAGEN